MPLARRPRGHVRALASVHRQGQQAEGEPEPLGKPALPRTDGVEEREGSLEVTLDLEVAVNVRLAKGEFGRRDEHRLQRARVGENERETRAHARVRWPRRAVPQADREIPRRAAANDVGKKLERRLGQHLLFRSPGHKAHPRTRPHCRRRQPAAIEPRPANPSVPDPEAALFKPGTQSRMGSHGPISVGPTIQHERCSTRSTGSVRHAWNRRLSRCERKPFDLQAAHS